MCIFTRLRPPGGRCAAESDQAKQELAAPIQCPTAEGDIRMLKQERASIGKEMLEGVTSFVPAGFVVAS